MEGPLENIGPYVLRRRLSEGGMGTLYAGYRSDGDENDEVAIKIVTESFGNDAGYLEAFRRESETAAHLDHPNIVQVIDRGEDQGRPYLVMELLHGRSLAEVFVRGRTQDQWLPSDLGVYIMAEVAGGLHHLHEAAGDDGDLLGMVHGDVSPQNIFLTHQGEVKLIDFGLAHTALKATDERSPAKVYGKVHYLAPEQALGQIPDRRSDVFAIGAALYEALTTHSAFSAASKFLVLLRITQGEPDPIRTHLPDIDPALEGIVERALKHDPDGRFPDASALARALHAYLEDKGIKLTPRHLKAYLTTVFGDEIDGARPGAARRNTAGGQTRKRGSTGKRVTSSINQAEISTGLGPWLWTLVGAGVGLVAGLVWVLHQTGFF